VEEKRSEIVERRGGRRGRRRRRRRRIIIMSGRGLQKKRIHQLLSTYWSTEVKWHFELNEPLKNG